MSGPPPTSESGKRKYILIARTEAKDSNEALNRFMEFIPFYLANQDLEPQEITMEFHHSYSGSGKRRRVALWLRGFWAALRQKPCPVIGDGLTDNGPILRGYQRGGGRIRAIR